MDEGHAAGTTLDRRGGRSAAARSAVALLAFLALANPNPLAAQGSAPGRTAGSPAASDLYVIGPNDSLGILVRGEPELSTSVSVRPDGRITVPLVEDVTAAGRTARDLARDLEAALSVYIKDPQVTVVVDRALGTYETQIRVVGEGAAQPTSVPHRADLTLLDVMIAVGGLTDFAAGNSAVLARRSDGTVQEIPVRLKDLVEDGDITANLPMMPGDVVIIPEGPLSGDWRWTGTWSLSTTVTDNYNLAPNGLKDPALITTLTPGFSVRGTSPRLVGAADVAVGLPYVTFLDTNTLGRDDGLDPFLTLTATGTGEVVRDYVFIDVGASVAQLASSSTDRTSVSSDINTNRQAVGSINVSPYLRHRYGTFADAELRYAIGASIQGPPNSFLTDLLQFQETETSYLQRGSYRLTSGRDFPRFRWTFGASASLETGDDFQTVRGVRTGSGSRDDVKRADVTYDFEYPLDRAWRAIGGVGYQYYDDGDPSDRVNGPTWRAGFGYRPNPRFDASATYGRSDDNNVAGFNLGYQVGPRTRIQASYTDQVSTPQEDLINSNQFIAVDPTTGRLIDNRTGQPFDPLLSPSSLDSESRRTQTFLASATTTQGPNVFGLSGSASRETQQEPQPESTNFIVSASWSRRLAADTSASLNASYRRSDEVTVEDTVILGASLSQQLTQTISGFVRYGFQNNEAERRLDRFTENVFTIGVSGTF
jgi:polysaccharide export outer membrane protein